ncbi:DUF86 domain-containing protein [Anaeromyxobacter sp. SG64]|uniref:HepT-like ribonuclease domain-containing protein n=1 Tax=unclassified Anaeromyxobacter TaxID=2620896 RepID=UPI0035A8D580
MLDAAREAMSFAAGRSRGDLERDRVLVLAIVKDVEIIGEAAARVSPARRCRHHTRRSRGRRSSRRATV